MNLLSRSLTFAGLRGRIRGMFNLNDPRWGRGDDKNADGNRSDGNRRPDNNNNGGGRGPNQGPPDLDELWRDFNRKLGGLFGGKKSSGNNNGGGFGGGGGNFQPDMKSAGVGAGLIALVVIVIWMGTGIFIVQEGQQAVITRFGSYN
ncbi:MAG TPA: protease modulator HflK N-terminal domain-containing protein, partial [Ramlibacter sp.]